MLHVYGVFSQIMLETYGYVTVVQQQTAWHWLGGTTLLITTADTVAWWDNITDRSTICSLRCVEGQLFLTYF